MLQQAGYPTLRDNRIVVEEDYVLSRGRVQSAIVGLGKTFVLFVQDDSDTAVVSGQFQCKLPAAVGRGVIDQYNLVIRVIGFAEDA